MEPFDLLPYDGAAVYYGKIFSSSAADAFYQTLLRQIEWRHDHAIIFGKEIITKRKVAWYADQPFEYKYSGITKTAFPWTDTLRALKTAVETGTGASYNSCLLNLYHDGSEGMAWHSDAEKDLKKYAAIASLSFGAERKFYFKHKQKKERIAIVLEHGSLLVMKDRCQERWLHRLPPTQKIHEPLINLTFRTIEEVR